MIRTQSINRDQAVLLPWYGWQAVLFQIGFVVLAVVLPAIAHLSGLPVRWLVPMHWPVILAGLLFGWRGGLTVGILAPVTNYLLTGYPLPPVLLAMTVELATYGALSGLFKQTFVGKDYIAVFIALVAGKVLFLSVIGISGAFVEHNFTTYAIAAMIPGLLAGVGQVVTLPIVARWWVRKSN